MNMWFFQISGYIGEFVGVGLKMGNIIARYITVSAYTSSTWGNAVRNSGEGCDDGGIISGDGWNELWIIESGWTWVGGSSSSKDTCEIWGDGKRYNSLSTFWDDGNKVSGDGCSSFWITEYGYRWTGGNTSNKDVCSIAWGDGIYISNSEQWDDGNLISNDGWSQTWMTESGFDWMTNVLNNPATIWKEIWGDSKRFNRLSTYCDDGNLLSEDGWNSNWSVESGWSCSGGSITTKDIWSEVWGDGVKFNTLNFYWDDGNLINDDGCTSTCSIESGYKWSGGNSASKDVWSLKISAQEAAAATATQSTVAVGTSISSGTSLLSMSSPIGIFASVNQFQLLILILISGAYISDGLRSTITGMSFMMFNFNFIKLEYFYLFRVIIEYLSILQTNDSFVDVGIKDGSTIVNLLKLILMILLLIAIHLLITPLIIK